MYLWGQKVLEASAHSISSPRPMPRRKKCPGTSEGNPDCQNVVLGRPKSWEKKSVTSPEDIHLRIAKEVPSHMG